MTFLPDKWGRYPLGNWSAVAMNPEIQLWLQVWREMALVAHSSKSQNSSIKGLNSPPILGKTHICKSFFFSTSHLPVVKQCAGQGGSEGHHRGHKKKPWRNQPCTDRCIPRLTGARTRALAPERDMEDLEFRRLTTRCFKRADERMIAANSQCLMMLGTSNDCKEHGFKKNTLWTVETSWFWSCFLRNIIICIYIFTRDIVSEYVFFPWQAAWRSPVLSHGEVQNSGVTLKNICLFFFSIDAKIIPFVGTSK